MEDNSNTKPHLMVVCALFEKDGKILIALRPKKALGGGYYELPGGKVEKGETLEEGLAREMGEELGVITDVGEKLWSDTIEYDDSYCHVNLFRCKIIFGDPQPLAADEIVWVKPEDLYRYRLLLGVKLALTTIYPEETKLIRMSELKPESISPTRSI